MEELIKYQKRIQDLMYVLNLLNWELRVCAPKDSKEHLIDVISNYEAQVFELMTSDEYINIIERATNSSAYLELSFEEQRSIEYLKNRYYKNKKVPSDFYEEYSKQKNITNQKWEEARSTNDYTIYKPYLYKMIDMTKEYYTYIDNTRPLYDVMLDEYEMGMTTNEIDKLFNDLKRELIPLIKNINLNTTKRTYNKYTVDELMNAAKVLLEYIGFDMNRGTLGIYPHGFTERMNGKDIRIAISKDRTPVSIVSTIIHEGGHGIFEQNIKDNISILFNESVESLYGLHESQSRFYENVLGRNINFWYPIYDKIKDILHLDLTIEEFVKELNMVEPSLIRTEADELTYCLHIIVRYEIERDIFNGNIDLDELPNIWNNKMKEYLGVEVDCDNNGLMQDVHWSEGSFGYFPSYLLGNIYDGMYISAIEHDLGNIDTLLRDGRIKDITSYLNEKIHVYGGVYNSKEVIQRLCNQEIDSKYIIDYFKKKYEG